MAMISDRDRKPVQDRLAKLVKPVKAVVFTQEMECQFCRETRGLIEEVAGLTDKLKALKNPLALQVFVTPTCPYCPRAVVLAFKLAMESPKISASMVEATEFPQLANKHQVSGVPHTVIGDSPQPMIGAYPEAAAVDLILNAVNVGKG